ncbi:Bug family tripartite tricarboxylate transporter substrate binding protein [Bacillus thermotolerans]|uniref:Bug family tripartite tricarboxylate transporter substrate binding protein n=1 Tax=Bacillus thermotolerans TaxID=1221996 RepID=UPI00057F1377|nr:tripartite tricarboxylate transporter substrate binding protein [Bacillus thermotolerans]
MKKIIVFSMLIFAFIIGGCSQANQPASGNAAENGQASDYPAKPIQLVVPTPAGGSYDTVARTFEKVLPKYLPNEATVVVVNKPGGKNTMGVAEVAKANPDGYTLGFIPSSTVTTAPHYGDTPYSYDSFQPIMRAAQAHGIMWVSADAPYKNYDEWYEYVKKNPGKFSVSTVAGAKSLLESINDEADINMNIVPYEGFAPAMTALLGGHVQGAVATLADAKGPWESGKIRPIFTSSGRQVEGVDAPTLVEKGVNIEENKLIGVVAPKGLSAHVLSTLEEAFKKAIEDPAVTDQIEKMGMEVYYGGSEEFQEDFNKNYKIDGDMLRKSGLIQ